MIADNRRKFCDCLPSYGNTLLRLSEIICNPVIVIADDLRRSQKREPYSIFCDRLRLSAIVCDCLRSYGNQSSVICDPNVCHNIFNSDP